MRILIIGAGAVSSVLSKILSKDRKTSEIVCASIDIKKARDFIDTNDKKTSIEKLDASKKTEILKIAKDFDLIINASLPQFNENIMEAALKTGSNYQDLAS